MMDYKNRNKRKTIQKKPVKPFKVETRNASNLNIKPMGYKKPPRALVFKHRTTVQADPQHPLGIKWLNRGWKVTTLVFWLLVLIGLIAAGPSWFSQPVQSLTLYQARLLSSADVVRLMGLEPDQPLIQQDVFEASQRLHQHALIESSQVRKWFPNRLVVQLNERRPMLQLEVGDTTWLLDEQLRPVAIPAGQQPVPLTRVMGVPVKQVQPGQPVESDDLQLALQLIRTTKQHHQGQMIEVVDVTNPLNLKLKLKDYPTWFLLGEPPFEQRLHRMDTLLPMLETGAFEQMDLRLNGQIVVTER